MASDIDVVCDARHLTDPQADAVGGERQGRQLLQKSQLSDQGRAGEVQQSGGQSLQGEAEPGGCEGHETPRGQGG